MTAQKPYEVYPVVPDGFDLLTATPERYDYFGIPQKPNAVTEPELFAFWKRLVSAPFKVQQPTFSDSLVRPATTTVNTTRTLSATLRTINAVMPTRGGTESNLNWSGALVTPPFPKRVVFAVGGWKTPTVTNPSLQALFTHSNEAKSLAWVGIDGHNGRLPRVSLPQIGTGHSPGKPQFAWFDWWSKPSKSAVKRIDDFDVNPGDEILAGLAVTTGTDVLFFIKNQTTGQFRSWLARQPLGVIEQLGSSVEWIMERPTDPVSRRLHPLPDYGTIDFKYCLALAAEKPLAPARLLTLANNGRMIKMREAFANPYRTVYVSRAKRRHDSDGSIGITCTFQDPA